MFEFNSEDFKAVNTEGAVEAEETPLKMLEGIINEKLDAAVSEKGALDPFTVEYEGYKATFDGTKVELIDELKDERVIDISGNGNEDKTYETFVRQVKKEVQSRTEGTEVSA